MLSILADENMPALSACFSSLGQIKTMPGRNMGVKDLKHTDALLVRSITEVNESLLAGSNVRFVGTATIGTDHIDQKYLNQQGIAFAYAPGSNAQSVVEYVLSSIAFWCQKHKKHPESLTVGIVGLGQIGGRLKRFFDQLGVTTRCCDPLLEEQGVQGSWCDLETVLTSEVVTLHVPYQKQGQWGTHHLLNADNMHLIHSNALLINSSRGAVVDNLALSQALKENGFEAVLDVWEGEPAINMALMDQVLVATPHIAGYAMEAKMRGTYMLYQSLCHFLGVEPELDFKQLLPSEPLSIHFNDSDDWVNRIEQFYDVSVDDAWMRKEMSSNPQVFDLLRKNYPRRREFLRL